MIQYIIAAGIGAFLGSRSKKSKKSYAEGGRVRYMLNGFEERINYILDSTNGVEVAREGSLEDGDLVIYFETKDDYAKGGSLNYIGTEYSLDDAEKHIEKLKKSGKYRRVQKRKNVHPTHTPTGKVKRGNSGTFWRIYGEPIDTYAEEREYYSDKQMKDLLIKRGADKKDYKSIFGRSNYNFEQDWEQVAVEEGFDVDVRNYKWFEKNRKK